MESCAPIVNIVNRCSRAEPGRLPAPGPALLQVCAPPWHYGI